MKLMEKQFVIPYDQQSIVSMLHDNCNIINEKYNEDGVYIKVMVYEEMYKRCMQYEIM